MRRPRVLIVDDEVEQRELLGGFLRKRGFFVELAGSVGEALDMFSKRGFDAAILDLRLPDGDGIELLRRLRAIDPDVGAVILTAYGTVSAAAEGIKAGASEFMEKPVDLAKLEAALRRLVEHRDIVRENRALMDAVSSQVPAEVVAESPQMKEILSIVARVAPTDAPVLITGESGTGKELVARLIHKGSRRSEKPFVAINCAAIPETLLESELFGYEPGAFTGARRRQPGKFELAAGGTAFLDEIGDFPPALQAKLLRFLEDGTFYRLGGTQPIKPDVRIISATNRDIDRLVAEGAFREDLFYRLNIIRISIPPLRERPQDLLKLAEMYLLQFRRKHGKGIKGFTPEARDAMLRYPWPGNVRELRNAIERAVILSRTEYLTPELLVGEGGATEQQSQSPVDLRPLAEVEKEHILRVLRLCNNNQSEAAKILGIHRNTLREKLKKYGIA